MIFSPFCAHPMRRTAIATPLFESHPLFSSSAIFQISPRVVGARFAPANTLTATSPVMTPSFWGSAWANICETRVSSAGVEEKLEAMVKNNPLAQ